MTADELDRGIEGSAIGEARVGHRELALVS
jgi:hypothetical protein